MKFLDLYRNNIDYFLEILKDNENRKYLSRWTQSVITEDYFIRKQQPWLTFKAIDFLNTLDLKGEKIFEYGSGGSTLFWLSKGCSVVSVEHNKEWYQQVFTITKNNTSLDYRFIEPVKIPIEFNETLDPSNPDLFLTADKIEYPYFKNYVCQIDDFIEEYFKIILIDGRARPSCIKRSISKLKIGGYLVLDNAEREYYLENTKELLNGFKLFEFEGIVPGSYSKSKTNIYKKLSP